MRPHAILFAVYVVAFISGRTIDVPAAIGAGARSIDVVLLDGFPAVVVERCKSSVIFAILVNDLARLLAIDVILGKSAREVGRQIDVDVASVAAETGTHFMHGVGIVVVNDDHPIVIESPLPIAGSA